ncbi:hypothetical protein MANES_04G060401v8 [Manihot esculenta]|uniref:Uncharacterized protein n=1 Tax=Manihot esculenta TaxID=3983 RepID=A0ACB7HV65_MANES|nr:hypothetical protein MANES_04G060401v8 [Manihot esculenta]
MESLIYQYELFKMKSDETINQMYDRFIEIIGGMKSLRKTFTNEELLKKILRCLPKEWLPKREQVEEPSKMKKNIALRVAFEDTSEEEEEISEEELALVTRRIRKLLLQNKKFIPRKNFGKEKEESSKKEVVICYECNKPGHYKVDCPKLKKPIKKFKKKAFKATWDESSDTEEEDVGDEIANMCFMALEESSDEVTTLDDTTLYDDVVKFSYDELVGALKLMTDELEKSHKKNKILKCELASLKRESENSPKEPLPSNDLIEHILFVRGRSCNTRLDSGLCMFQRFGRRLCMWELSFYHFGETQVRPSKELSAAEPACGGSLRLPKPAPERGLSSLEGSFGRRKCRRTCMSFVSIWEFRPPM